MDTLPPEKPRIVWPGRDIPWKVFFKRLGAELANDVIDDAAAMVTFYSVLALFPFLIFTVALLSRVVSWETIEAVVNQVARVTPRDVTVIVSERLTALKTQPVGSILTLGFIGTLWSASTGVASLMPALNKAYNVEETRPFWKRRLIALAVTVGVGAITLVAALLALVMPAVSRWLGGPLGTVLGWLSLPLAALIVMQIWALLYMFLPNVALRFRPVTPGLVVGVLLWAGASWGFGQYVQRFGSYESTYGALGGVIVLLLWMWVSTMTLLLGAEIDRIMMPEDHEHAEKVASAPPPQSAPPSRPRPTATGHSVPA